MSPQHPDLATGRWQTFPLVEQLANVGSEVERAMNRAAKGNPDYSRRAFWGENEYGSSEASWRGYFHAYAMAVAIRRQGAR